MKRASKFVTILGVKIPLENIRAEAEFPGWVSYKFHFVLNTPPPRPTKIKLDWLPSDDQPAPKKIGEYTDYVGFSEMARQENL